MIKRILKRINPNNTQIKSYGEAVRKGQKSQHVIKIEDGWALKRAGSARVSRIFNTQKEAADHGKNIAKKQKTAIFIHGIDGRIKEKCYY